MWEFHQLRLVFEDYQRRMVLHYLKVGYCCLKVGYCCLKVGYCYLRVGYCYLKGDCHHLLVYHHHLLVYHHHLLIIIIICWCTHHHLLVYSSSSAGVSSSSSTMVQVNVAGEGSTTSPVKANTSKVWSPRSRSSKEIEPVEQVYRSCFI